MRSLCWPVAISVLVVMAPSRFDHSCAQQPPNIAPGADLYGDLLPQGAVARMGTVRWRHGGSIFTVTYSPHGKLLASGSWDGSVRLWDAQTGKEIRQFQAQPSPIRCVAFSPD